MVDQRGEPRQLDMKGAEGEEEEASASQGRRFGLRCCLSRLLSWRESLVRRGRWTYLLCVENKNV